MRNDIQNAKKGKVLVFNPTRRLVGVFHSLYATATAFNMASSTIHNACTGKTISAAGNYFRLLQDGFEIEESDWGTLKLEDYDKACGVQRKYHKNNQMR